MRAQRTPGQDSGCGWACLDCRLSGLIQDVGGLRASFLQGLQLQVFRNVRVNLRQVQSFLWGLGGSWKHSVVADNAFRRSVAMVIVAGQGGESSMGLYWCGTLELG